MLKKLYFFCTFLNSFAIIWASHGRVEKAKLPNHLASLQRYETLGHTIHVTFFFRYFSGHYWNSINNNMEYSFHYHDGFRSHMFPLRDAARQNCSHHSNWLRLQHQPHEKLLWNYNETPENYYKETFRNYKVAFYTLLHKIGLHTWFF